MRIWPQCIPCIYVARSRELLNSQLSDYEKVFALTRLAGMLAAATPFSSTIRLATDTYRFVKLAARNADPYSGYKAESNSWVKEHVIPRIQERVRGLSGCELLRELLVASIALNALDPGVPGYGAFTMNFTVGLGRDESAMVCRLLSAARRVAYILDNAGEALLDLEVVKVLEGMGLEVYVVAKSGAYQNDVTEEEARALGFGDYARVVGTGSDSAGPLPGELSKEVLELLSSVDVILAKGMANFEAFEEWCPPKPVIHVLLAKCVPVASAAGVAVGEGVIAVRFSDCH
ncbi:MAG: ARMT1-like domain-containing protein [Thermofilaceae archaeon]